MLRGLLLLVVAIVVVGWTPVARACSCASWSDTARRLESADAVFVGTVETTDVPWVMRPAVAETFFVFPLSLVYAVDHEIRVRFAVERRYAGAMGSQVWVNTGDFPGFDCEQPTMFSESTERWLVFAHERDDGELHVGTCMYPIGELERPDEFRERLAELGAGSAQPDPSAAWSAYRGRAPWRTSGVLASGAVLLLWWRRKRRQRSSGPTGPM